MNDSSDLLSEMQAVLTDARDTFRAYAACCYDKPTLDLSDAKLLEERAAACDRVLKTAADDRPTFPVGSRVQLTEEALQSLPRRRGKIGIVSRRSRKENTRTVKFAKTEEHYDVSMLCPAP